MPRFEPVMALRDRALVAILSVALIALSVAALAPSLHSADQTPEPTGGAPDGRGYVEGVLGRATNASPFGARSAADRGLVALLFRGLVHLGPDSSITADLASSWEVDETGSRWTFHLRPDQRWQDGEPITAGDVAFTVGVLSDPTYDGPGAASWRDVRASVIDPMTVVLELSTPLGGFLQAATQPIAPAHLLEFLPPDELATDPFGQQPVGSGPFRLVFLDTSRAFLAAATPVDPPAEGPGVPNFSTPRPTDSLASPRPTAKADVAIPYLSTFELRYYDDAGALLADWQAEELDAVSGIQPADVARFRTLAGSRLVRYPGTTLLATALNLRAGHTEFQDPAVRTALLEAIDRDALVSLALPGVGTRADSLIPPTSPMFDAAKSAPVEFNLAEASRALRAAGWKQGNDGWTPKGAKEPIIIELLSPEQFANPVAYATAAAIVESWHALGLAVRQVPLPASELLGDRVATGEFQVAVLPFAIGLDPDVYPLLASSQTRTGGSNVIGLQDLDLDALLVAARSPVAEAARHAAYGALQERLAARQYILPLAFRDDYVLFRDTVVGPESRSIGSPGDRYWDVLTWRLADGS
ncbi:MAG TPA: peptide ABC transporter substrate-binding protein [Candidatus Limnocylindria bacterium]|nr:peptide ABC transporter substrate-binding protein [Candidatus Limnocylindria bacterium]